MCLLEKYRKKPIMIEAIQLTSDTFNQIIRILDLENINIDSKNEKNNMYIILKTSKGNLKVSDKDYLIKDLNGGFYPCKPDIFKLTYEEFNESLGEFLNELS